MNLNGRAALVTGASRGIGRAIAMSLARAGADVAVAARTQSSLESLSQEIRAIGRSALALPVDVTSGDAVRQAVERTAETFNRLDILVNNAGITKDGLVMRMSDHDWDEVLDVDLRGVFFFCRAAARLLRKSLTGRVINISSVVGLMGNAGQVNYAAAKAGLFGLTRSLAKELGGRGITVNCVCPGFIETDMTKGLPEEVRQRSLNAIPVGRLGKVEDIAEVVTFLAGDAASYISGTVIPVDGGMSLGSIG